MSHYLKKPLLLLLFVAIFCTTASGSVFAKNKIVTIKDHPKNSISAATAVSLIVKGLNLNIDNIRFIKEPKASDYYTKVKDNAPYAGDFIIAQFNGLELPKDINPSAKVTREQFAKWLFGALSHKGEYAWIEIYRTFADENQVTNGYMDSIQKLLIAKIVSLDGKQKFYPTKQITYAEATAMVKRTAKYIKDTPPVVAPNVSLLSDAKLAVSQETDAVTRVTLSVNAPHPGYGLEITNIQFVKGEAVISYRAVEPDPDKMYIQMITELKAVTYIPSSYKAVLGDVQPTAPFPG